MEIIVKAVEQLPWSPASVGSFHLPKRKQNLGLFFREHSSVREQAHTHLCMRSLLLLPPLFSACTHTNTHTQKKDLELEKHGGTGSPAKLWNLHPSRFWKPRWTRTWATSSCSEACPVLMVTPNLNYSTIPWARQLPALFLANKIFQELHACLQREKSLAKLHRHSFIYIYVSLCILYVHMHMHVCVYVCRCVCVHTCLCKGFCTYVYIQTGPLLASCPTGISMPPRPEDKQVLLQGMWLGTKIE